MPDGLTTPDAPRRPVLATGLLQLALGVLVVAGAGALAGVVWEWVWTAPAGVVVDHRWLAEDEAGLRGQFSGTGWYVVVATVAGLLAGALVALFLDRVPLLTLLAVVLGSVLGTWLMLRVGSALGPADPTVLARTAKDGTHLPDDLTVSRHSPWVALPGGALVAMTLVFFGLSAGRRRATREASGR